MKETNTKSEKSRGAVKQAGKALDKGFAKVKTPSQAADVLDRIENAAGGMEEQDLAPGQDSADPIKQAAAGIALAKVYHSLLKNLFRR